MIILNVKTLREALRGMNGLKLAKQSNPVLRSVHLRAGGGWLFLSATDLDQRLVYQCRGEGEGECLLPVESLKTLAKAGSARSRITIEPERERHRVRVEDGHGQSEAIYPGPEAKKFPEPEAVPEKIATLPGGAMSRILEAQATAGTDPNREILRSILVEPDAVVSTNGRQLFRANSLKLGLEEPVIVPAAKALKVFDHEKPAHLFRATGTRPLFRIAQGPWEWTFRRVEGTYPDYGQVFPKSGEKRIRITLSEADARLILGLGKQTDPRSGDAVNGLRVQQGHLRLMVGSKENRRIHRLAPEKIEGGEDAQVFFQHAFLRLAISQGLREMSIRDELSPVVFKGEHRMNLFMPVQATVGEREWNARPVSSVPAKPAATEADPPGSPSEPDDTKASEDALEGLLAEAMALKAQMREMTGNLSGLIKRVRLAQRERSDLERNHRALKRSVRSLQRLGV